MAHSIEVRPPFLDHRIVEFAASLPAQPENRRGETEGPSAASDEGPAAGSVPRRKKIGFDIPAHEWLRGPLRPLLGTLADGAAEHGGLFRPARSKACVCDHFDAAPISDITFGA